MKRLVLIFQITLIGISLFYCRTDFGSTPEAMELRALGTSEKQIVKASDDFGLKLFKQLSTLEPKQNTFISPLSVSMALGMAYNGATGQTEEEMKQTLGFTGMTNKEINTSYKSLIDLLLDMDPKVDFILANSIWYRQDFEIKQDFLDINTTYFNAVVHGLDFNSPTAPKSINDWVATNTNGKINQIVDQIDPYTIMFLLNAVYFKGSWLYEFDKDLTKTDTFNKPDDETTSCEMMYQKNDFQYHENDKVQIVNLPYGNKQFSMLVILPRPEQTLSGVIDELDRHLNTWISNLTESTGSLYLPKFSLEYEKSLNDVLKAMGMKSAFEPRTAEFNHINDHADVYISKVRHKSFIDVNEEGTEAAAVTSVEFGVTSVGGGSGFVMRVDRPFLFIIRENHTQSNIFAGKVLDPGNE